MTTAAEPTGGSPQVARGPGGGRRQGARPRQGRRPVRIAPGWTEGPGVPWSPVVCRSELAPVRPDSHALVVARPRRADAKAGLANGWSRVVAYVALTKPRIIELLLVTTRDHPLARPALASARRGRATTDAWESGRTGASSDLQTTGDHGTPGPSVHPGAIRTGRRPCRGRAPCRRPPPGPRATCGDPPVGSSAVVIVSSGALEHPGRPRRGPPCPALAGRPRAHARVGMGISEQRSQQRPRVDRP